MVKNFNHNSSHLVITTESKHYSGTNKPPHL